MEINISGIRMEVRKKKIKNLYLSVKPPDGRVVISAPISMSNQAIEHFAKERLEWPVRQRKKFEGVPLKEERQYLSGETLYIWGKPYTLLLQEGGRKNSFLLRGSQAVLSMHSGSTVNIVPYLRRRSHGFFPNGRCGQGCAVVPGIRSI